MRTLPDLSWGEDVDRFITNSAKFGGIMLDMRRCLCFTLIITLNFLTLHRLWKSTVILLAQRCAQVWLNANDYANFIKYLNCCTNIYNDSLITYYKAKKHKVISAYVVPDFNNTGKSLEVVLDLKYDAKKESSAILSSDEDIKNHL